MEVYLIRHTAVAVEKTLCYGNSDVPLKDSFPEEVKEVKKKLPSDIESFPIFSSPLKRCRRLAETLGGPVSIDQRLTEFSFGDWELKDWSEISREDFSAWIADIASAPVPGGDRLDHFQERIAGFWEEMTSEHERAVIVSHTGVIHALLAWLLHIPLSYLFTFDISYGGISLVGKERDRWQVRYINR